MLDTLTRAQRLLLVTIGALGVVLFAALTLYFATAATGHPRVKHMVLFIALALISALVAWFAWPGQGRVAERPPHA